MAETTVFEAISTPLRREILLTLLQAIVDWLIPFLDAFEAREQPGTGPAAAAG